MDLLSAAAPACRPKADDPVVAVLKLNDDKLGTFFVWGGGCLSSSEFQL
jgi:hypothetical protein